MRSLQLKTITSIFILLSTISHITYGQTLQAISDKSKVIFEIKNAGLTVEGSFSNLEATIVFNPENLADASFSASIPVKTIDTGINARDTHLKSKDYFEVETYPNITFISSKIEKKGTSYVATGNLTIKDVTKEAKIIFKVEENGLAFKGELSVNRLKYNVGESSWILGDEVKTTIYCLAKQSE